MISWAKVFNLKQMAQTVNFLTEHDLLDYDVLAEKAAATARHNELSAQIKAAEKRIHRLHKERTAYDLRPLFIRRRSPIFAGIF